MKYILDGKTPVLCNDIFQWGTEMEKPDRVVAQDHIGEILISTVFLGLDHSFGGDVPILFETMIFGGKHDQAQWRYTTWEEAEAGHKAAVELVKSTLHKTA